MRHPPHLSHLFRLLLGAVLATAGTAAAPMVTASGSAPACTVECSTVSTWDGGFQGSVTLTELGAAGDGRSLGFDMPGNRTATRGRNARWSQSGGAVTAASKSWNGTLANGASITADFLSPGAGASAEPGAFRLDGTLCNADPDPDPTGPTGPAEPPTPAGELPLLHGMTPVAELRRSSVFTDDPTGGLASSNDLGRWLQHRPQDPAGHLAAAWHVCNVNIRANEGCWRSTLAPVCAEVPSSQARSARTPAPTALPTGSCGGSTTGGSPSDGSGTPGTAPRARPRSATTTVPPPRTKSGCVIVCAPSTAEETEFV